MMSVSYSIRQVSLKAKKDRPNPALLRQKSRIPPGSLLFEKVIPVLLVILGIVMLGLVLFAVGVLAGLVRF